MASGCHWTVLPCSSPAPPSSPPAMFRTPLRVHNIRCLSTPVNSRNLVSSVLLTRTWENDSLTDLKQEAKKRGLPQYAPCLSRPSAR
ncbi:hypothetical protein BV25DRAFT_1821778 [Artomyces pyxidatus]|uniref:Uncharacterized protein n=1 Tax=Artomyces pyxidatus TaxID=48021 RepID=A0ACB8TAP1_9AGAM|nr:hypothetical protein BV25DRAFT_1821778 [Artomyces pyxidatus]